jgi:AsmA family protein
MKLAVKVTGAVALALVAGVVGMDLAGWPGLAPWLAARADRGLSLDSGARLHLIWKPRLEAPQLKVTGRGGEALAQAEGVLLNWQWGDIRSWRNGGPLRLRLVQAEALSLDWQRDANGRTAWPLQPSGSRQEAAELPRIDHLIIRRGSARLDDAPLQLKGDARFATEADGRPTSKASCAASSWR